MLRPKPGGRQVENEEGGALVYSVVSMGTAGWPLTGPSVTRAHCTGLVGIRSPPTPSRQECPGNLQRKIPKAGAQKAWFLSP